jgi:hypothetical protein
MARRLFFIPLLAIAPLIAGCVPAEPPLAQAEGPATPPGYVGPIHFGVIHRCHNGRAIYTARSSYDTSAIAVIDNAPECQGSTVVRQGMLAEP